MRKLELYQTTSKHNKVWTTYIFSVCYLSRHGTFCFSFILKAQRLRHLSLCAYEVEICWLPPVQIHWPVINCGLLQYQDILLHSLSRFIINGHQCSIAYKICSFFHLVCIITNEVCHPDGHHWNYYPGTLSLSQVTATLWEIGHL